MSNAVINDAEIVFQNNGAHWRISRITGQYSVDLSGTVASGYCVPGKEKKFRPRGRARAFGIATARVEPRRLR